MMHATPPVWDDADAPALPVLDGDVEADTCVIGLGGSGLAAVLELLALGERVVGLEAATVAAGAAGHNGGFLLAGLAAFHHDAVRDVGAARAEAMYRLTIDEIARMAAETPRSVRLVGSIRLADGPEERADCEVQLAVMRDAGLPVSWYDGPLGEGLFVPTDGAFQPMARCRELAARAIAGGARLFGRSAAIDITGDAVRTARGVVRCRRAIVAMDGALPQVLPELAGRVRCARLQMLATAPTTEVQVPCPVYTRWGYDYWQQTPDGRIALGGFRDVGGEDEWTADPRPSPPVQDALEHCLRTRVGVQAPITHRWAATVGYTSDRVPVVEEVRPGVWAFGGYSGTGNVIGALLGRAVARRVVTGESAVVELFRGTGG